jgi:hypothetical protein
MSNLILVFILPDLDMSYLNETEMSDTGLDVSNHPGKA